MVDAVFRIPELLAHVLGFCALGDVPALRRVCKQWRCIPLVLQDPGTWIEQTVRGVDCARLGDLAGLKSLFALCAARPEIAITTVVLNACGADAVGVAQWLVERAPAGTQWPTYRLLRAACDRDSASVVGWLFDHFGLKLPSGEQNLMIAFHDMCRRGHLRTVQCMIERFEGAANYVWPALDNPLVAACGTGQRATVQCLVKHFQFTDEAVYCALYAASTKKNSDLAEWLIASRGCGYAPNSGKCPDLG